MVLLKQKGAIAMLVYEENVVGNRGFKFAVSYEDQDALGYWEKHYANSLILKFFLKNGSTQEKLQAQKEMEICERKMKHWEQHRNFDSAKAVKIAERQKKVWVK
jgi:hypothetical protein